VEDYPRDLIEFEARFSTEEACRDYLLRLRWPDGFRCPACGHERAWPVRKVWLQCARCGRQTSATAGTIFQDTRKPLRLWFRAMWQYWGGPEEGVSGRQTERKALIAVAVEEKGAGMGRLRMRRVRDASAASLIPFVEESVEPGSLLHSDGWMGYEPLEKNGYQHRIVFLSGRRKAASELLPRVHKAISLLKRWMLGTHQGAISHEHLDYYLDEFVFRFNRRSSRSRGKLFYRLVQQAVAVEPTPYRSIVADWDAEPG
jgi:transposase-like protein